MTDFLALLRYSGSRARIRDRVAWLFGNTAQWQIFKLLRYANPPNRGLRIQPIKLDNIRFSSFDNTVIPLITARRVSEIKTVRVCRTCITFAFLPLGILSFPVPEASCSRPSSWRYSLSRFCRRIVLQLLTHACYVNKNSQCMRKKREKMTEKHGKL